MGPDRQELYELTLEDPLEDTRTPSPVVKCVVLDTEEHYLHIKIPYLNSFKETKENIDLKLYAPKPVIPDRLVGGGVGWSSKLFDRVAYNEKLNVLVRNSSSNLDLFFNVTRAGILKMLR